jgi:hypothetical protein
MSLPFNVMAKPAGPFCNIDRSYCYYTEKTGLCPDTARLRMTDAMLERYTSALIASQAGAGLTEVTFCWQGGEPTVLGIDFYRRALALQTVERPQGMTIRNALQTNGTLIDAGPAAASPAARAFGAMKRDRLPRQCRSAGSAPPATVAAPSTASRSAATASRGSTTSVPPIAAASPMPGRGSPGSRPRVGRGQSAT